MQAKAARVPPFLLSSTQVCCSRKAGQDFTYHSHDTNRGFLLLLNGHVSLCTAHVSVFMSAVHNGEHGYVTSTRCWRTAAEPKVNFRKLGPFVVNSKAPRAQTGCLNQPTPWCLLTAGLAMWNEVKKKNQVRGTDGVVYLVAFHYRHYCLGVFF